MSEPCTAMVHLRILCSLNVLYVRRRLYWFLLYCMDAWAQLVSTNVSFMLIEQQLCQLGGGRIGIPSRNNTFTYCKIQIGLGTGGYWWFVDARGLSLRRWKATLSSLLHLLSVMTLGHLGNWQGNSMGNFLKLILDIVGSYWSILNRSELGWTDLNQWVRLGVDVVWNFLHWCRPSLADCLLNDQITLAN